MVRIVIAGIVGGIVMFFWGAVSHLFLGVGSVGVQSLPNEDAVIACMKQNIPNAGLYLAPGIDMSRQPTDEEAAAWTAKYETGPNVFLVYRPTGVTPMSPRHFGYEILSNILAAIVGAFILSWTVPSIGRRALLAAAIGVAAWLSINVSYWDWYRFPANFVASELLEQVVGWGLSGTAMAFVLRSKGSNLG